MTVKRVEIPYAPRKAFMPYHERLQRFAVLVARRRGGKSVAAANDTVRQAVQNTRIFPAPRYAFIGPLFKQTRRTIWDYFVHYTKPIPGVSVNLSNHEIRLPGGQLIYIDGADNPDAFRGGYLDHVVLDEFQDWKPLALEKVVMPMLSDYRGGLTITGSAKGRNQLFKMLELAKGRSDWFHSVIPYSGFDWPDTESVEEMRGMMVPEVFAQEYECDFDAAIVGAYYGKELAEAERDGRITSVAYNANLPVHTAWDLGIGDSTAIWFFQIARNEIRVIDHYENHGQSLKHYAGVLKSKPYRYEFDWVPHDARVRELGTGRTRVETMREHGMQPRLVPDHKIMDGINAARLTLPRCWFDADKCKDGLEALRQYQTEFDEKTRAFKDTPKHDWTSHTADAFRYLAMAWRELAGDPVRKDPIAELIKPRTMSDIVGEIGEREVIE